MSKPTDKVVSAGITSALVETEQEDIQHRIFTIHGMQVMLDSDLAKFYGIETKRINEQVKRNPDRFPEDFVFQLTKEEVEFTRSQNATLDTSADGNLVCTRSQNASLNTKRGQNIKYLPYVFTEEGVAQLSGVLRSPIAAHDTQYPNRPITLKSYNSRFHDRFLIIDDNLYHFGASFKDLGKRLFAFDKMGIDKEVILNQL